MKTKLYQCPYERACKCNLENCCLYCETFGEYLNGNTIPYANFETGKRISSSDFSFLSRFFDIANEKAPYFTSDIISGMDKLQLKREKS